MGGAHPGLDRSERMLCRASPYLHGRRTVLEATLHVVKHGLVLPSADAPVLGCRALGSQRAAWTGRRPVLVYCHALLDACEAADRILARRAAEGVALGVVDEVTLVVATFGFGVRREHLWHELISAIRVAILLLVKFRSRWSERCPLQMNDPARCRV